MSTELRTNSSSSTGLGLYGLLLFLFVILKLNPGEHLTTVVVDWPWFQWWGVCVFCPVLWVSYLAVGLLVLIGSVIGTLYAAVFLLDWYRERSYKH